MRNKLQSMLQDVEEWLGLSLTIKDQSGVLVDSACKALFPGREVHANWFCNWRRAGNNNWRNQCIRHCNHDIAELAHEKREAFIAPLCWKGLYEIIVPVFSESGLAFIIYAGVFRAGALPSEPVDIFTEEEYLRRYRQLPVLAESEADKIMRVLTTIGNGIMHEISSFSNDFTGRPGIIQKFLSENYNRKIYLEDIAKILHLSPSRASHFIKEQTGSSFSKLLLQERVTRVRNLLISSDMSLAEIAGKTGFNNEYYLSRQFVRLIGMPPQKYRKSHKS